MTGRSLRPTSVAFMLLLGLLGALPPLSIDVVAPTLPVLRLELAAGEAAVGLVVTMFMIGFAAGQFAAGLVSDVHGRRPVLLVGLVLYCLAAIGCTLSESITSLVAFRAVQGIGAGACSVLTFAMVRDLFQGDAARVMRSYLTVIFGVAPMVAPLIGVWISDLGGWTGVYLALTALGIMLLAAATLFLAESRSLDGAAARPSFRRSWRHVAADRTFVLTVVVNSLSYACIFTYIAASPFVFIGSFELSPATFGAIFAATAAAMTAGAAISGRCARAGVDCTRLLRWSLRGAAAAALLLALALGSGAGLALVLVPLIATMFCRGLTAPNLQHHALEPIQQYAGTAAAMLGVAQILSGALASAAATLLFPLLGAASMGLLMGAFAAAAGLAWSVFFPARA